MSNNKRAQIISLAACCQAATMISQAAKGKSINKDALSCMLTGVMATSPDSVLDVYNDIESFQDGSRLLVLQLSGQASKKDVEVTRYLAGVMALSKRLLNSPDALNQLQKQLDDINRRMEHFDINDPSIIANFADAYSQVISPLGQKIQVMGSPAILSQPHYQNLVRALLMCAVRAAVLWRQMGGKRRQFIFSRRNILQEAQLFNQEISTS